MSSVDWRNSQYRPLLSSQHRSFLKLAFIQLCSLVKWRGQAPASASGTSCDLFFLLPLDLWCSAALLLSLFTQYDRDMGWPYMGANGALSSSCREEAKKRSAGANTPKNSNYFPFPEGSLSVCLFSLVSSPGIPLVLQEDRWCYTCVYLSFVLLPRWANKGDVWQCISFMDSPLREHDW